MQLQRSAKIFSESSYAQLHKKTFTSVITTNKHPHNRPVFTLSPLACVSQERGYGGVMWGLEPPPPLRGLPHVGKCNTLCRNLIPNHLNDDLTAPGFFLTLLSELEETVRHWHQ